MEKAICISYGGLAYYVIMTAFELIMWHAFGFEALGAFDAIFLLDDKTNVANVIGCIIFEKFEFEEMRDHLLKKTEDIHRCRSKLVKKFGIYWFKKMSD